MAALEHAGAAILPRCAAAAAAARSSAAPRCATTRALGTDASAARAKAGAPHRVPPDAPAGAAAWLDVPEGRLGVCSVPVASNEHAPAAAQAAWLGLRRALGGAAPTFAVLSTSFAHGVLSPLAFLAARLSEARGDDGHVAPLIGCTAPLWLPGVGPLSPLPQPGAPPGAAGGGEPPDAPRAAGGGGGGSGSSFLPPAGGGGQQQGEPPGGGAGPRRWRHHVTLSGAALPGFKGHLIPWQTHDSVPWLPYRGPGLAGAQPQVLLLGHPGSAEHMEALVTLLQRFESLFPGSALAGAIAGAVGPGTPPRAAAAAAAPPPPPGAAAAPGPGRQPLQAPPSEEQQIGRRHVSRALLMLADASGLSGAGAFRSALYDSGLIGLLLDPPAGAPRLAEASGAALLRLVLGAQRLGSRSLGMTVMPDALREQLCPTQELAAAFEPPCPRHPEQWVAARVTPEGLAGEGCMAPQQPGELPLFVLPSPVAGAFWPGLWPGEEQVLNVFEGRYKLLHDSGGGGAVMFGLASSEGYGCAATVREVVPGASPSGNVLVRVGAGRRFRCVPGSERALPGTFGLAAAAVEWVDDAAPPRRAGKELVRRVGALLAVLRAAAVRERLERGGEVAASARFASALGRFARLLQEELTPPLAAALSLAAAAAIPAPGAAKWRWFVGTDPLERAAEQWAHLTCAAAPPAGGGGTGASAGGAAPGAARLAAERQAAAARFITQQLPEYNPLRQLIDRELPP
ncbi:MAG: hypothetical protein J3K34DRAFT_527289 [Monoraphidium minutum]|nr:MAG: hypothetical protein J3K34DRAFT_527289 [Monoraphidium minutum]